MPKPNSPPMLDMPESEVSSAPSLSKKAKRRWPLILGSLLLAGGAAFGGTWWLSRSNDNSPTTGALANQPQAVTVKLETLKTDLVKNTTEVVGTLEARRSVALKPEVAGRVVGILVNEGDRVSPGQAIAQLDSRDLDAQLLEARANLARTQAELAELEAGSRSEDIEEARAKLQAAQARLANTRGGARPEEIAQAESQLQSARAEAELAVQRANRYRQLRQAGAISADQYQEYQIQATTAAASVEQAQRRLAELSKGRSSDINELQAAVEQEKQNLRRLENGPRREVIAQARAAVAEAIAQVRNVDVQQQKTLLKAPIAGVVGDIPIKLGDYVSEGDNLTTITQNNSLELNLSVPIEKANQLRLGLPVEILDTQGKAIVTGNISFIAPNVTPDSQLILAKAAFANFQGQLLDRQFIQARIVWDTSPGVLVPTAAISRLGAQTFVFVAESDSTQKGTQLIAKQRQVTLGNLQGNQYQVLSGLQPGDKIVTAGILNLSDGVPIVQSSAANKP